MADSLSTPRSSPGASPIAGAGGQAASEGRGAPSPLASISLPKGGGAIRGMGEKFAANPVTGTGSMTVPIATSPGRSGFGPQLSLSYDSGAGNGPFGFGWNLALPSITRKTDKGLPQYDDAAESDVFILSGAEDLVPEFERGAGGEWLLREGRHVVHEKDRMAGGLVYRVRRYRPRTEGLFSRIERWTRLSDGDVHWRSISRDNVLTVYGRDTDSRIQDPENAGRVFSWLICETRDDKGNAILYRYKRENGEGVELTRACERNRGGKNDAKRAANRYLKSIHYGNRIPLLDGKGGRPVQLSDNEWRNAGWMFEVVFDYGEHDPGDPRPGDQGPWPCRADAFSTYRAGFEVRTARLCRRVLMFHHFPDEPGVGDSCLVRSTDFAYSQDVAELPVYAFLESVTQTGYRRKGGAYEKRSLPPVEFGYSRPVIDETVRQVDPASLEHLPIGVDGASYQWVDLHGEGIPGIFTEQAGAWLYRRNLSPLNGETVEFSPLELVAVRPAASVARDGAQFLDLAGDGLPDLVMLEGPTSGLYEHDAGEGWLPFRPFSAWLRRPPRDPNVRFVDLDGDGHADVLITEDDALVWHASLAEEGFGPARRVAKALDEEKGPRLVFADGTESVHLADLSGDGLQDLIRIRNGEICYWPNLGYGRFGAKVTMDDAPLFDRPDLFDQKRVRLADIDGSGTTDILYLRADGVVRLYFNESGNGWSKPRELLAFPRIDDVASIAVTDLRGNGTACLVWSSSLPGDARTQMRYLDLMGGRKPHLLVRVANNLGAETHVQYTASTVFYQRDREAGKPWITRLPFPVHVVERVEVLDRLSRNRFVTRYAYHHGYFDGEEREFRGFGMVEQRDTEEFSVFSGGALAANSDAASHLPPVLTRSWFHTGAFLENEAVSNYFAGLLDGRDRGEYYREPALRDNDEQARKRLLPDTVLPASLGIEEAREACRTLKGSLLRQEVYALDGTAKAEHPYVVTEQNFAIQQVQPRGRGRHGVFFTHAREAITYHYERDPADPRVQHALTLRVDAYGNVLSSASIGYGRRIRDANPEFLEEDHLRQALIHVTCTQNGFTNAIAGMEDQYRVPTPAETRTYEVRKPRQETNEGRDGVLFGFDAVLAAVEQAGDGRHEIDYEDIAFDRAAQVAAGNAAESQKYFRRLIEHERTLYRPDDLGASRQDSVALLPLGSLEPRALSGEGYKLAFTPGLLDLVFLRDGQRLLPADPSDVLKGGGPGRGGYVRSQDLKADRRFPSTDTDGQWWIPTGRAFLSPGADDAPAAELAYSQRHFFLPLRYRDPFHTVSVSTETRTTFDAYDLLVVDTADPLGNRVTTGERKPDGTMDPALRGNDYRVLQPWSVMDPNRNRSRMAFDALGMPVGTAVMGKPEETLGDSLDGFEPDLALQDVLDCLADPIGKSRAALGRATNRLMYDLFAYHRTKNQNNPQAPVVCTLARETHDADLGGAQTKVQCSFSYSDGFGRDMQKKAQAEPGPVPRRGVDGEIVLGADGQPEMTANAVSPRWVGSGWTIFNNKGKPVRKYEPFFSDTHRFEFGVKAGVSAVLFYDPIERVIATLHPNHTYEKVLFSPWQHKTYDVNDTVAKDPRIDPDTSGYVQRYFDNLPSELLPWLTWRDQRSSGALGAEEQTAASKAAAHADTPSTNCFDSLGRPFLTFADNGPDPLQPARHLLFANRVDLDIEGNQCVVRDSIEQAGDRRGRIVMRYDYDMLGSWIHQSSMEAGQRWMLNDAAGKPILSWDSRGHAFRVEYDALRRPVHSFVKGADPEKLDQELLTECLVYGERHPKKEIVNVRGKLYVHFDQAGILANEEFDFKGNRRRSSRRLAKEYRKAVDWKIVLESLPVVVDLEAPTVRASLVSHLETESFSSRNDYDALNRLLSATAPDGSVYRPKFNEANLLEKVDVNLRGAAVSTAFVTNIDYDAKGQRKKIQYGNGAATDYDYDQETFRLMRVRTRRPAPANGIASQLFNDPRVVQDLKYTYDPVGNITRIADDSLLVVHRNGSRIDTACNYGYDPLYRLTEATGREHVDQSAFSKNATGDTLRDYPFVGASQLGDPQALRNYTERYAYDAAGNFESMMHQVIGGGWTRSYSYEEPSLTEPSKWSNRLSSSPLQNNLLQGSVEYAYDVHGNMLRMPHLPFIRWNHSDQLQATARQVINAGIPEMTWYTYNAAGQRVRKVTESAVTDLEIVEGGGPVRRKERIYLGDVEIYREYEIDGVTPKIVRETLHIMDDKRRIALINTHIVSDATPFERMPDIHYELANHLRSGVVDLNAQAQLISYEEYAPYGSPTMQAGRNSTEISLKRYRYTGKERDEESGLCYHQARYLAPWLARWSAPDPFGPLDGANLYAYARSNPIKFTDSTGGYSWSDFGSDVWSGVKAIAEPALIVADFGQMAAATITHKWFPEHYHDVEWLSSTGKHFEQNPDEGLGKRLIHSVLEPELNIISGGAYGLIKNIHAAIQSNDPEKARSILVQGASGQVLGVGLAMGMSKYTGTGWTGRESSSASLKNISDAEINSAVEAQPTSNVAVQIPAENLSSVSNAPYGKGGQIVKMDTQAKSSVPNAKGEVKTTTRFHDADPNAPKGSDSSKSTTMSIEQAKGARRVVPDPKSSWGGRWIHKNTASSSDWADAHIRLFRDAGGSAPFLPRIPIFIFPTFDRNAPAGKGAVMINFGGTF